MCLLPDPEVTETVRWRAMGGHTQEAFTALSFRCLTTLEVGWVYRKIYPVSRNVLREVANQYHNWAERSAQEWGVEIVDDLKHAPLY